MDSEKGLSPLIAVVLLIAFTITVATFIAAFSQSFIRGQTEEFEQQSEQVAAECDFANIRLTNAVYDSEAEEVTVLAENRGEVNLTDFTIIAFTSQVDFVERTPSNSDVTMDRGDIERFTVGNITTTPQRVRIKSGTCPTNGVYTCSRSAGAYIC